MQILDENFTITRVAYPYVSLHQISGILGCFPGLGTHFCQTSVICDSYEDILYMQVLVVGGTFGDVRGHCHGCKSWKICNRSLTSSRFSLQLSLYSIGYRLDITRVRVQILLYSAKTIKFAYYEYFTYVSVPCVRGRGRIRPRENTVMDTHLKENVTSYSSRTLLSI